MQDLLDEWLVHYHHRPHQGLRHPVLPKAALTPNQMWAALTSVAGYVPVPLTRDDYLELLPVLWQAITERGIRLHHRTYDCDLLAPYRGQPSPITARGGKWEVHTNPHDARQIWLHLPDGTFAEIPWIHRAHVHRPFNEQTWQHIRTTVTRHTEPDSLEADLADALDQLMRRTRTGNATAGEQRLLARTQPARTPLPPPHSANSHPSETESGAGQAGPGTDADSLDDLDEEQDLDAEEDDADDGPPAVPYTGLGLYDARTEALKW
ncbi:Mu transposase C-terminal domain-containing protein [Streptomyces phaeochromogenes]